MFHVEHLPSAQCRTFCHIPSEAGSGSCRFPDLKAGDLQTAETGPDMPEKMPARSMEVRYRDRSGLRSVRISLHSGNTQSAVLPAPGRSHSCREWLCPGRKSLDSILYSCAASAAADARKAVRQFHADIPAVQKQFRGRSGILCSLRFPSFIRMPAASLQYRKRQRQPFRKTSGTAFSRPRRRGHTKLSRPLSTDVPHRWMVPLQHQGLPQAAVPDNFLSIYFSISLYFFLTARGFFDATPGRRGYWLPVGFTFSTVMI